MASFSVHYNSIEQLAQKNVRQNMAGLTQTLTRMSTGKRINSAKDDPAGLIATELARAESTELRAQLKSTKALGQKLATTDSYLASIGNLLNDIKGKIVEGASTGTLSNEQLDALQLEIDYALDAIERITRSGTFNGQTVLDGLFSLSETFGGTESDETGSGAQKLAADCTTCATGTASTTTAGQQVRTDALANLVTLFSEDEDSDGLFSNVSSLLSGLSQAVNAVIEPPGGEETAEVDAAVEETPVDEEDTTEPEAVDELSAEDELEATKAELEAKAALLTETTSEEESTLSSEDTFEAFFAEQRERDTAFLEEDEPDPEPVAAPVEEAAEPPVEETSAASDEIEADEPESEAGLLYESSGGGYVFRILDTYDFLDREEEAEETTVRYEVGVDLDATQANLTGFLLNQAAATSRGDPPAIATGNLLVEETETDDVFDLTETEEEDDVVLGGSLSDLRSGGVASLRNDPARADSIINQAISALSMTRARIGAEQKYTVDVDIALIQDKLYQNAELESMLSDTDYAVEAANLARYQLLLQSSMKVLEYSRNLTGMLLNLLEAGYNRS